MATTYHKHVERLFTPEECSRLRQKGLEGDLKVERATVGGGRDIKEGLRRSYVTWLPKDTPELQKVRAAMHAYAAECRLSSRYEFEFQLTRYDGTDNGVYGWHMDCGEHEDNQRVVSCSVMLSDPHEFDGGELRFQALGRVPPDLKIGDAAVFRSWLCHRVEPVTRGRRWSLVSWMR